MPITILMTKKRIAIFLILIAVVTGGVFAYKQYQKNTGVYVETERVKDGWGYKIYVKGELVVNQYVMPAVSNNQPFPNEESARKTAELVVQKVGKYRNPMVTADEVTRILKECK